MAFVVALLACTVINMLIPMMCFVLVWVYPIYVNLFNREMLDIRRETKLGIDIPEKAGFARCCWGTG
jgi:hypothetical protein